MGMMRLDRMPRRLLTVTLLLMVGLVIASAVAPPPEDDRDRADTATAPATTPRPAPETTAAAPADLGGVAGVLPRDKTVKARRGEEIDLRVTAGTPTTFEIPALGALQPASPGVPAQFIVVFAESGRYDVRNTDTGASVGSVLIAE